MIESVHFQTYLEMTKAIVAAVVVAVAAVAVVGVDVFEVVVREGAMNFVREGLKIFVREVTSTITGGVMGVMGSSMGIGAPATHSHVNSAMIERLKVVTNGVIEEAVVGMVVVVEVVVVIVMVVIRAVNPTTTHVVPRHLHTMTHSMLILSSLRRLPSPTP